MGRPLLFIDFDGVINQFPDDKVMRRQGRTGWMRPDDPHRAAYAPDNWPCAPLDAGTWPPAEYDRWLDEHWDDPAEKKRLQYRANAIADPKRLPDRWIQACLWTITPHDVADIRPA